MRRQKVLEDRMRVTRAEVKNFKRDMKVRWGGGGRLGIGAALL